MDVVALVVIYTFISVFERFFFLDVRMQQNGQLYSNINIIESAVHPHDHSCVLYDWQRFPHRALCSGGSLGGDHYFSYHKVFREEKRGAAGGKLCSLLRGAHSLRAPFITVLLMEWALSSCDRLALRSFSYFDELGIYDSAMKIVILLITFKNTFIAYWSPVAMERFENGINEANKEFFRQAYELAVMLCITGAAFLILFRKLVVAIMFEITVQSIKFSKRENTLI